MKNQVYTGTPTSRRFALCPTSVKAGDPCLLGTEPGVALDDYQAITGGTTFLTGGTFTLTVIGQTVESPQTTHQMKPGDKVYLNSGTLDSTTNVTTGGVLDANSNGTLFGLIDPSYSAGVAAGVSNANAQVRLQGNE